MRVCKVAGCIHLATCPHDDRVCWTHWVDVLNDKPLRFARHKADRYLSAPLKQRLKLYAEANTDHRWERGHTRGGLDVLRIQLGISAQTWKAATWTEHVIDKVCTFLHLHPALVYDDYLQDAV